jgi:hypothetical protein
LPDVSRLETDAVVVHLGLGLGLGLGSWSKPEEAMARGGEWAAAAAVALWWMVAGTEAVWLEIRPSATKCVSEDIQSNVVVIGDYSLLYEHHHVHPTVSVNVINQSEVD